MTQDLSQLFADVRLILAKLSALDTTQPVAVKRRVAARLMGIGVTKLDQLIGAKKVRTAEDRTLVPMSEVRRYCAPKVARQRRPAVGRRARIADGQSDAAIAESKARIRALRGGGE